MMTVANVVLIIAALALGVPVGMFCLEVLVALLPRRRAELPVLSENARVAVAKPL